MIIAGGQQKAQTDVLMEGKCKTQVHPHGTEIPVRKHGKTEQAEVLYTAA